MGEEKKNRHFYLGESVTEASMKEIIKNIRELNRYDDEQEKKVVDYEREPIELIVSSYGGSVYDGFGLVDVMGLSKTPIHTVCIGKAMSVGFIILIAGHKRFMTPMATAMYHQISTGVWAELEKIKRCVKECERLEAMYDTYVLKRTNLMKEKLDDVKSRCEDWYISAEDCKKLGIVDEILEAA
jgi:ATP-dependent Clp protease, protease subunit